MVAGVIGTRGQRLARFSGFGVSFRYPARWHAQSDVKLLSTVGACLGYLSSLRLLSPCDPAAVPRLLPNDVLIRWYSFGSVSNFADLPGSTRTVGGRLAKVEVGHPGSCRSLAADETIEFVIPIAGSDFYLMQACLRGPDLDRAREHVDLMLDSVRFA